MPLREDLLVPIPGDNPSGKSLRYERVYDQIKEARTEEDDTLPSGAWERSAKRADFRLVIKLATEVLSTKSKDLQIAAWLGEAHIKQDGAAQLGPVLELLLQLQENFWDTLYPELDEGDAGLRAVPLQWAANRYANLVYDLPLTRSRINFLAYKAARALGSEADTGGNEARRKARAEAIERGQPTSEEVDQAIAESPKSLYVSLEEALQDGLDRLESLASFCEERYGDDGPSFRKLRESLEQVHNLVQVQLNEKRRLEPDAAPEPVADPLPPAPPPVAQAATPAAPPVASAPVQAVASPPAAAVVQATPAAAPAPRHISTGTPASWEDAEVAICSMARYMAQQRRGSAVPYLLQTSIRWGELRREMPKPPLSLMEAPSPQDRAFLQAAAAENRWNDVLERSMVLIGDPAGRACLDLQHFVWQATSHLGFGYFAEMVVRSVHEFLVDLPDLPKWFLADNTPTADAATLQWISTHVQAEADGAAEVETDVFASVPAPEPPEETAPPPLPEAPVASVAAPVVPAPVIAAPQLAPVPAPASPGWGGLISPEAALPAQDTLLERATAMAGAGQLREATRLLARDAATQPTGRLRYRRRLDLAQLCVTGNSASVAAPVLRELIAEIDDRKLESWEEFDMVTRPMTLMLQCMTRPEEQDDRERLLARLSRIDPTAVLDILS